MSSTFAIGPGSLGRWRKSSVHRSSETTATTKQTPMTYANYSRTERSFDRRQFVRGETRTRPMRSPWQPVNETRLR